MALEDILEHGVASLIGQGLSDDSGLIKAALVLGMLVERDGKNDSRWQVEGFMLKVCLQNLADELLSNSDAVVFELANEVSDGAVVQRERRYAVDAPWRLTAGVGASGH